MLGVLIAAAVAFVAMRVFASVTGSLFAFFIARAQQRTRLQRTTFARYEPRDVASSLYALLFGGLLFTWLAMDFFEPPTVDLRLPLLSAPFGDQVAPDAPTRYEDFVRTPRLPPSAPDWPEIAPDTLWVPVYSNVESTLNRKPSPSLRAHSRMECGFDRTRPGAPLRCIVWAIAPIRAESPPLITLAFERSGVAASATGGVTAIGLGATPLTPLDEDAALSWNWDALGRDPKSFEDLRIMVDGEAHAIDLDDLLRLAADVSALHFIAHGVDDVVILTRTGEAARFHAHWGEDRPTCAPPPIENDGKVSLFQFWRTRLDSRASSSFSTFAPERRLEVLFGRAPTGAFGDRCAAASFALAFIQHHRTRY